MPKKTPQFFSYFLQDCLNGDSEFTKKPMFSGFGVYKNGKIFAIYAMKELFFKVGENNIEDYKKYNSRIFEYEKKGKRATISYYILPDEILENREELDIWIEKSLEVETKITSKKKTRKDLELDNKILEKLLEIPEGKVTTYKILADIFKVHPRRIASVMKTNKNPDIFPCYKVISHSRKIGGYSGLDGIKSKINMLKADGIKIINEKIREEDIYKF